VADDSTICSVCGGKGWRARPSRVGHMERVMCWRCNGTGLFVRREDAWPYRR
jgi:hypothetical protein